MKDPNLKIRRPRPLTKHFFARPTLEVARQLLGVKLATFHRGIETSGMIVEVEAYLGTGDQASHSYRGPTKRNQVMFWEGGHCYVYLIYGVHHCVNVVTEAEGSGCAVLIRALQPLSGISSMQRRREVTSERNLTNGPGKLCQALGIDRRLQGHHFLTSPRIRLEPYIRISDRDVVTGPRIGITRSTDLPWRFFVKSEKSNR